MWRPPSVPGPGGPGGAGASVPRGWGSWKRSRCPSRRRRQGGPPSGFSQHVRTWAWAPEATSTLSSSVPIPHLAAGPHNPQPQPGSPSLGPGKATGLGTQHTSESSRLALYPTPPLPFAACAVDPLSPRARHLFPQTQLERKKRSYAVAWSVQLLLTAYRLSLWGFLPSPPQGTLGKVWRHFSCLTGGLLLASGVEGRGAAPSPKTH